MRVCSVPLLFGFVTVVLVSLIVGKVEKLKLETWDSAVAQVAVTAVPALILRSLGYTVINCPEQPNDNNNPLILLLQYTSVDGDGL